MRCFAGGLILSRLCGRPLSYSWVSGVCVFVVLLLSCTSSARGQLIEEGGRTFNAKISNGDRKNPYRLRKDICRAG